MLGAAYKGARRHRRARMRNRIGRLFGGQMARASVCSGGHRAASRAVVRALIPATDVAHRAGRRGREDHLLFGQYRTAHERHVRGRAPALLSNQMATLLQTDAAGLDALARNAKNIYEIAARCGVFAKSDIQPLINEESEPARTSPLRYFKRWSTRRSADWACGRADPRQGCVFGAVRCTFCPPCARAICQNASAGAGRHYGGAVCDDVRGIGRRDHGGRRRRHTGRAAPPIPIGAYVRACRGHIAAAFFRARMTTRCSGSDTPRPTYHTGR